MIKFDDAHPQSETHCQKESLKGALPVPTLSMLPPTKSKNELKFQKCILLLFKPFSTFQELYNGIDWSDTYSDFLQVTDKTRYIENIEELHKGIDHDNDTEQNSEDIIRDFEDIESEDDILIPETDPSDIDAETNEVIRVIETTPWINESVSNPSIVVEDNTSHLPASTVWIEDMNNQNQEKLNNPETDNDDVPPPMDYAQFHNGNDEVTFTMEEGCTDDNTQQHNHINNLREEISLEHTLNTKQKKAFEMATENIIKRHLNTETSQVIAFIGGPGGTGKSQVIKAITSFHKKMKILHTLKLSAMTGTAAKHIGGSTTTTMFGGFKSKNIKPKENLL